MMLIFEIYNLKKIEEAASSFTLEDHECDKFESLYQNN